MCVVATIQRGSFPFACAVSVHVGRSSRSGGTASLRSHPISMQSHADTHLNNTHTTYFCMLLTVFGSTVALTGFSASWSPPFSKLTSLVVFPKKLRFTFCTFSLCVPWWLRHRCVGSGECLQQTTGKRASECVCVCVCHIRAKDCGCVGTVMGACGSSEAK